MKTYTKKMRRGKEQTVICLSISLLLLVHILSYSCSSSPNTGTGMEECHFVQFLIIAASAHTRYMSAH